MTPTFVRCLAILAALFVAPANAAQHSSRFIELPQASGGSLSLEAPAQRLVALSPHLAELIFAAEAGDLLAGTVAYSDFPAEVTEVPRVGDAFRIDAEQIHIMAPDLVLAWHSGNPGAAIEQLRQLGLKVWSIEIREPDEIAQTIDYIGRATGRSREAEGAVQDVRKRIARLTRNYSATSQIPYFYQVAASPLFTISGEHLISRSLALCGGENIFRELTGLAPQVSVESVLLANPRVVIAPEIAGADPLEHWISWPQMRAVAEGNLLLLSADEISRATPRMLNAVEVACRMLDDLRSK